MAIGGLTFGSFFSGMPDLGNRSGIRGGAKFIADGVRINMPRNRNAMMTVYDFDRMDNVHQLRMIKIPTDYNRRIYDSACGAWIA